MSKKNIILICLTMFLFILAVPAYSGTLDGKTFVGQSGKMGKKSSAEEELSFQNGKLYSAGCAKYGFGESDYTAKVEGDSIHFKSNMVSPNNGEIAWEGTVQGDKIEANFVWTKKRWYWKDAHQVKWLKGSLQN